MQGSLQDPEDRSHRAKRPVKEPRVARSRTGLGVFAGRHYKAGEIVGEIEGQVIDDLDYSSSYCMDLGDTRCLEPAEPFRYVNHSCEPNCYLRWYDVASKIEPLLERRMFLLTYDAIRPGEQLTIDYSWPAAMAISCRCGTQSCRGWIVSPEDLTKLPGVLAKGH